MRDAHAAEHDVIAVAELVDVEAEAGAHVAERGELGRFGAGEILVGGELHVAGLALERGHLESGPFGQRGIVGEILAAGRLRAPMRLEQGRKAEGLRRLHDAQMRAVERAGDARRRRRRS